MLQTVEYKVFVGELNVDVCQSPGYAVGWGGEGVSAVFLISASFICGHRGALVRTYTTGWPIFRITAFAFGYNSLKHFARSLINNMAKWCNSRKSNVHSYKAGVKLNLTRARIGWFIVTW